MIRTSILALSIICTESLSGCATALHIWNQSHCASYPNDPRCYNTKAEREQRARTLGYINMEAQDAMNGDN